MYNTRRATYMNSCSVAMDMPAHNMHNSWNDDDYGSSSCHDDMNSGMNSYHNQDYCETEVEKKPSRKRANTTSSSGENKRTANKICRVCGDKAFSYNFNVITCESCKAFFRRNANKEKEIRCPFNDSCEINVVSRRFCQRCRLTKCFTVGMKKEWIMTDEARLEKKARVEENRERRAQDARNQQNEMSDMQNDYQNDDGMNDGQEDDSDNSYDEAPMSALNLMDFGMPDQMSPPQNNMHYNHMNESKSMMGYQNHPNSHETYQHHNFDFSHIEQNTTTSSTFTHSHGLVDNIPTGSSLPTSEMMTSANSMPGVETDVTMANSHFLAPPLSTFSDAAALLVSPLTTETNLIQAAAQSVINQSQIAAAAVVASQVVASQVVAAQLGTPASTTTPLIPAINSLVAAAEPLVSALPIEAPPILPITTIPPISTIAGIPLANIPPIIPPLPLANSSLSLVNQPSVLAIPLSKDVQPAAALLKELENTSAEMITISKDMLLSLVQDKTAKKICTCTCACGRYLPGTIITEEVTKDLLQQGGSSTGSTVEPVKDETKLDTAEDMQLNGLLPSEDSNIQWMVANSNTNVVDPTVIPQPTIEEPSVDRRESVFRHCEDGDYCDIDIPNVLNYIEREKMDELNEQANQFIIDDLHNGNLLDMLNPPKISSLLTGIKKSSQFENLDKREQKSLLRQGLYAYIVVRYMQHHETLSLHGLDGNLRRLLEELVQMDDCNFRMAPGMYNALAMTMLFDCMNKDFISPDVDAGFDEFSKLLAKTTPDVGSGMMEKREDDEPLFFTVIPKIQKAADILSRIAGNRLEERLRGNI